MAKDKNPLQVTLGIAFWQKPICVFIAKLNPIEYL